MKISAKNVLLAGTAIASVVIAWSPVHAAPGTTVTTSQTVTGTPTGGNGATGATNQPGNPGEAGILFGAPTITVLNNSTATGGNGGAGVDSSIVSFGTSGGQGGAGAELPDSQNGSGSGAGNHITLTNGSTYFLTGGQGGTGGTDNNNGGTGGVGGNGVFAGSDFAVINNAGTLQGGAGGAGGVGTSLSGGLGGTGGSGLYIEGANVIVDNSGLIVGGNGGAGGIGGSSNSAGGNSGNAIAVIDDNVAITNQSSGEIRGGSASGLFIQGAGAQIANLGTVTSTIGTSVLNDFGGQISLFSNTGTISTVDGRAIVNNSTITNFINTGLITATGLGAGVYYNDGFGTSFINDNGEISTAGNAFRIDGSEGSLLGLLSNNQGLIQSSSSEAIALDNATITTLNNTNGEISSDADEGILNFVSTIGSLNNNGGLIRSDTSNAIYNFSGLITALDNTGGEISAGDGGRGIYNYGAIFGTATMTTITNSGGTIAATDIAAIQNEAIIGTINNDNGIISSTTGYGLYNHDGSEGAGSIVTLTNDGGLIEATQGGGALYNEGSITNLDNTNGIIRTLGDEIAIDNDGSIGTFTNAGGLVEGGGGDDAFSSGGTIGVFDNSNGILRSSGGSALELYGTITSGAILNTNGLIQNDNSSNSSFYIGLDLGEFTVTGGTIINVNTANNNGRAVRIDDTQSGVTTFNGVRIISDGTVANSGQGQALRLDDEGGGAIHVALDSATYVRGRILNTEGDDITLDTAAEIIGNITFNAGNDIINFNGGSITGAIESGTGVDALNVNADFTTGGTINTDNELDITVASNAGFTINHSVDTDDGDVSVLGGGSMFLNAADLLSDGTFLNAGTTRIGVDRELNAFDMDATAGSLVFDARGNGGLLETGHLSLINTGVDLTNQTVSANFLGGRVNVGERSLIANGDADSTLPSAALTDNSFLYNFGLELESENIFLVLTDEVSIEEAATTDNNRAAGSVLLEDLDSTSDTVIQQIQANLGNASTQEEFNEILEATQPTEDNGNAIAATAMTGAMFDLADGQLAMVNTGVDTGVASGNMAKGLHPWVQAFGGTADQDGRNGVDGYNSQTYGGAFGIDTRNFNENLTLGISFGYGHTDVDSDNANDTETDVDSYQLLAYSNYDLGNDMFATGMGAYGWNKNEQTRQDVGGIAGLDARADYDSWVAAARGSLGRNFYGTGKTSGLMLTSQVFSEYIYFDSDGYTETGAGGANLSTSDSTQNILNLGLSAQASYSIKLTNGSILRPDLHISYKYDVLDNDQADTTSTFTAGGSTFPTNGIDPSNSTFSIGTGLKLFNTNNWDFTANYDYTFKSDYNAHSGFLRAAYEF